MKKKFRNFSPWLKKSCGMTLDKVEIAVHLGDVPALVLGSKYGYTGNMERIIKSQVLGQDSGSYAYMMSQRIMQINPRHPMIVKLYELWQEDPDDQKSMDVAYTMCQSNMLSSGFSLGNPNEFNSKVKSLLMATIGLSDLEYNTLLDEIEIPLDDDEEEEEEEEGDDDDEEEERIEL